MRTGFLGFFLHCRWTMKESMSQRVDLVIAEVFEYTHEDSPEDIQ